VALRVAFAGTPAAGGSVAVLNHPDMVHNSRVEKGVVFFYKGSSRAS